MSRLVTGAFVALMAIGFLIMLTHGRLDEALLELADYLRGHGQLWIWGSLALTWGVMSAGMVFSHWRKTSLLRLIGQFAASAYLLFLILAVAKQAAGDGGEPDLLVIAGLSLSALFSLFFLLDAINKHFQKGEVVEA